MTNVPSTPTLTLNREELLQFFDEKHNSEKGDATGIVAAVGEDLNAACFQHYSGSRGDNLTILPGSVTTGKPRGPWLDRWLLVKPHKGRRFLYQTEIKNWSSTAIGGEALAVDASPQDVVDYKQRRWERHWDSEHSTLKGPATAKVLVPMKRPKEYQRISAKPLLIFWEALGPKEKADAHLFSIPVTYNFPQNLPRGWPANWVDNLERTKRNPFDQLSVFSVSSYLRSLTQPQIQLQMPNAVRRLQALNSLFSLNV